MNAADTNAGASTEATAVKHAPPDHAAPAHAAPSLPARCINFAVFQAAWFASVLGAARGWVWAAPAGALVALAVHLMLTHSRRKELMVLLSVASLGIAADALLVLTGVVAMRHESFNMAATILWFASLWISFATTLNSSMSWLTRLRHQRILVACLFGAIGGPMAYLAGQRLGAISLSRDSSLLVLAVEWAGLTPLAVAIAARLGADPSIAGPRGAHPTINRHPPEARR